MAKTQKEPTENQLDLFGNDPIIGGLGLQDVKLNGHEVKATLIGVTNVHDIGRLKAKSWKDAVSDWLINLHQGDIDAAIVGIKQAYVRYVNEHGEPHRPTPDEDDTVINFLASRDDRV